MKNGNMKPATVTPEALVAELRTLASLAEANGDRFVAVRALKFAWHVENRRPANPVPTELGRVIALSEAYAPLMRRFAPDNVGRLEADITELRRCQLELALLQSEIPTVH